MTTAGKPERGRDGADSSPRRWWVPPAKLVLTAVATWLIMRGAGIRLSEAWTVDWAVVRLNIPPLILSVPLLLATFAIGAILWSRILEAFGETGIGVAEGAAIHLVANLGRYVPGKIVQLAGLAVLARRRGLSGVVATAAAVTAQVMHLLGAVAVGGWVALRSTDVAGRGSLVAAFAIMVGLATFLYLGGAGVVIRWILQRGGHTGESPRPDGFKLLLLLPGYLANWLVFGAAFVCLGRGLGLEFGFWTGTTSFAAAYFLGYIMVFAPAGIGVREGALVTLLVPALGVEAAVVLAALQRVWITAVELAGALAGVPLLRKTGVGVGMGNDETATRGAKSAGDP